MRLSVRPGVRISHATGVSRDNESAPKQTKTIHLSQDSNPISGQSDSRVIEICKLEKKTLVGAPAVVPGFACVTTQHPRPGLGILTQFPFDRRDE